MLGHILSAIAISIGISAIISMIKDSNRIDKNKTKIYEQYKWEILTGELYWSGRPPRR